MMWNRTTYDAKEMSDKFEAIRDCVIGYRVVYISSGRRILGKKCASELAEIDKNSGLFLTHLQCNTNFASKDDNMAGGLTVRSGLYFFLVFEKVSIARRNAWFILTHW